MGSRSAAQANGHISGVVALLLLVASLAIFAHHAAAGMGAMTGETATCVAVAAHAFEAPSVPAATLLLAFASELAALCFVAPKLRRVPRRVRARAGPSPHFRPLRC